MQNRRRQHHSGSNHFPRRRPRSPSMISVQPGQVAFRIICHDSIVGGVIGPCGSVVSPIRRDTGCVIHFEDLVPGSEHRIILVVGSGSEGRRILLKPGETEDGEEVEELVSGAQEAVLRVVERMWEVDAERDGGDRAVVSEGYCGLLADRSHIGRVLGKGGWNVTRMKRESGATIRKLSAPPCAAKDDELVQIAGGVLAVKKALVAVTACMQNCPPGGTDEIPSTRHVEKVSYWDSSNPHTEFFPHLSSLLPTSIANAGKYSLPSGVDMDSNQTPKSSQKEVSFRLLCSNGAAGSIIGKKGSIVRTLQNRTGAAISFGAPMANSSERVVTVTALEVGHVAPPLFYLFGKFWLPISRANGSSSPTKQLLNTA
uniref:KH domain-containing protein At4g18375 isoform X7 n=1 Tax=Rhizophora mucronata TaxID=61149 RepID=A0A2P2KDK3_RHIMU